MYSNNIVNCQESMTILDAHTKKSLETYCMHLVYIYIYIYIYIYNIKEGKIQIRKVYINCNMVEQV